MNKLKKLIELVDFCWSIVSPEMQYIAIDKNGGIWAYEHEPIKINEFTWGCKKFTSKGEMLGSLNTDVPIWEQLLFKRPVAVDFTMMSAYAEVLEYFRNTNTTQQGVDFVAMERWYYESHAFAPDTKIKVGA